MGTSRVAIIGAGVAGMSAARSLALLGHAPLMIAPAADVVARGETLSPRAGPTIEKLGWSALLAEASVMPGQGRFSVWGDATLRRSAGHEGGGYHLDRAGFEAAMAATLGDVERVYEAVVGLEHAPGGVRLRLASGETVEASVAIDCTGRQALSSGPVAERKRLDRLVCAWSILDLQEDAETIAATMVEAVEQGWWYSSVIPGNRMMIGLFTDSDLLTAGVRSGGAELLSLLKMASATSSRLDSLGLTERFLYGAREVSPAATIANARMVEGNILRAGDAAAALDPLGANGLASALWSGAAAADAALRLCVGEGDQALAYERSYLVGIAQHLGSQQALYGVEKRFGTSPFWTRRQTAKGPGS